MPDSDAKSLPTRGEGSGQHSGSSRAPRVEFRNDERQRIRAAPERTTEQRTATRRSRGTDRNDARRSVPNRKIARRRRNGRGLSGRAHAHAQAPRGESSSPRDEPTPGGRRALRARGDGRRAHRSPERRCRNRLRKARRRIVLFGFGIRRRTKSSRRHESRPARRRTRAAHFAASLRRARAGAFARHRSPRFEA